MYEYAIDTGHLSKIRRTQWIFKKIPEKTIPIGIGREFVAVSIFDVVWFELGGYSYNSAKKNVLPFQLAGGHSTQISFARDLQITSTIETDY